MYPKQKIYVTRNVAALNKPEEIKQKLNLFFLNEWGDTPEEDKKLNVEALKTKDRIMGSYTIDGQKIWIIMEAGHEIVTVLFPEEY